MRKLGLTTMLLAFSPVSAEELAFECSEQVEALTSSGERKRERRVIYVLDDAKDRFSTFIPGRNVEIDWCRNTTSCEVTDRGGVIEVTTRSKTFGRHLRLDRKTGDMSELVSGDDMMKSRVTAHCVATRLEELKRPPSADAAGR